LTAALRRCEMNGRQMLSAALVLGLLAALAVGSGWAQGPENGHQVEGVNHPEATAYGGIPIQGRLTDAAGKPVPDGEYTLTFRLYENAYGGKPLCEDVDGPPDEPLNPVEVSGGLFHACVDGCSELDLDGRWLYLSLEVGDDGEMSPRQLIGAVPYARSLKPEARVVGDVSESSVLHIENVAETAFALGGYASATEGTAAGVYGFSNSPTGLGGVFGNSGGGYALSVSGGIEMWNSAGPAKSINMGDRYRDNGIVAWAKITGGDPGTITAEFGISSVDHYNTGCYKIYLDVDAAEAGSLIPMAIAEVDSAPVGAGDLRIVSVNQLQPGVFTVYINDGNGSLVNNDFVFMATGR
jgi:hypothetical protein